MSPVKYKPIKVKGLAHLKQLSNLRGADLEVRGRRPHKFVLRYNPGKNTFFVFDRMTERCSVERYERLGPVRTALRAGRLWTCEGLRYDQILKWPWQIKLAQEKRVNEMRENIRSRTPQDVVPAA